MLTLGLHLSTWSETELNRSGFGMHDTAAALVRDNEVIVAIEEERLNRVKHCNFFPARAVEFCLREAGVDLAEIDSIAINNSEHVLNIDAIRRSLKDSRVAVTSGKKTVSMFFESLFGEDISDRLVCCPHHVAHAWSAFPLSGFEDSLVVVLDGDGMGADGRSLSGLIGTASGNNYTPLREIGAELSLGNFYTNMTNMVGYDRFDEYKVMGLAPYGNPERFRALFRGLYRLEQGGHYQLNPNALPDTWSTLRNIEGFNPPRRKGMAFTQAHMDYAASLQETLEILALHIIKGAREETGKEFLSYAGGVAHNCTLNGKLLDSGLFREIFVQPAAHDAGAAIGAALYAEHQKGMRRNNTSLDHLSFGTPVPEGDLVHERLSTWGDVISVGKVDDICLETAQLIADGAVVGWVQGRSEFGPRALGNRSILADPRPEENKERINKMIKKREGYRPFAPSVLEEQLHEYFDVPDYIKCLPFMTFVVPVNPTKRELLGAITHVDGTARVQTVSKKSSPKYWQLIKRFGDITGVPVLLNTSFNNNAEPIVDSIDDAVACFLTTNLTHLVIGDYLVTRGEQLEDCVEDLKITVRESYRISTGFDRSNGKNTKTYTLESNASRYFQPETTQISEAMFALLTRAGNQNIGHGCRSTGVECTEALIEEAIALCESRVIHLRP